MAVKTRRMTRAEALNTLASNGDASCLIHAGDRDLWWRAGGSGYTDDRKQAGRYKLSEAVDIIRTSGPEKRNRIELA